MRIGFLTDPNNALAKFRIRGVELFPVLNSFPNIKAEVYIPFENYTHIVCQESRIEEEMDILTRLKKSGVKIILDWSDVIYSAKQSEEKIKFAKTCNTVIVSTNKHQEFLKNHNIECIVITDGVSYQHSTASIRDNLSKLVWYGSHDSKLGGMQDLLALNKFFRNIKGCELTIISNDSNAYARVASELEIPSSYVPFKLETFNSELLKNDIAILPYPNNKFVQYKSNNRLLEAFIREMPVICGSTENSNKIFQRVNNNIHSELGFYYTSSTPTDFLDTFDSMRTNLSFFKHYCHEARKYILENELFQNKGVQWLEVFNEN